MFCVSPGLKCEVYPYKGNKIINNMPIHKVTRQTKSGPKTGYKFGSSGKVYPTREQALKQARAIFASGYKPKTK